MKTSLKTTMVILFLVGSAFLACTQGSSQEDDLAHLTWDGVNVFHAVDRQVLQAVLDLHHRQSSNGINAPQLYFPDDPVFPGELSKDEHVAYFDFGTEVFLDFEGPAIPSVAISIPLLTDGKSDAPAFALTLGELYQRSHVENLRIPNIAFPYIPIDEVDIFEDGAYLRNGEEEMRVSFERHTHPCEPPALTVFHEFGEYTEDDLQMGALQANFDGCDGEDPPESASRFCSIVDNIRDDVARVGPNFCQSAWESKNERTCNATFAIEKITPWFRDFVLVGADPINIVATQSLTGNYTIGIKYPCVE